MPRPKRTKIRHDASPPRLRNLRSSIGNVEKASERDDGNRRPSIGTNKGQTADVVEYTSRGRPTRRLESVSPSRTVDATPSQRPSRDNSILSIANFRRRPRQPSILRMVQQTVATGDDGPEETFHSDDTALLGRGSTPLRSDGDMGLQDETSIISGKKRKLSEMQEKSIPSSPPEPLRSHTNDFDTDGETSGSFDLPDVRPSIEHTIHIPDPEVYSETMAPPQSSSSPAPTPAKSQPNIQQKPKKKSIYVESSSPISSDLETNLKTRTRGAKKQRQGQSLQDSHILTTAKLQTLLPRRRNARRKMTFDILSSSDHETRSREHRNDPAVAVSSSTSSDRVPHSKIRAAPKTSTKPLPRKRAKPSDRNLTKSQDSTATGSGNPVITYRRTSNKENVSASPQSSASSSPPRNARSTAHHVQGSQAAELADAARKFREVDAWDLEFESVDLGGGLGSSSPRWR